MQDPYTAFAARADLDQEEMERMRRDIKKKKAQIDDLERENRLLKQRNYELSIRYGKLLQDCNHPFELVFSDSEDKKEISSTSIDIDTLEELAPSEETNKGYYVKASADTQEITHGARDNLMHSASRLNQAAVEQPDGDAASSNASVLTRPLDAQDRQVEPGPESTKTSKALATEAAGEKDSTKNSMSMSKDKQLRNLEGRLCGLVYSPTATA
ncbi:hypothetical protein EV182_006181 [Spiromyces aspiralis]|uniref:Uncharacterized protein n=1 Tax=Spiromyces aspiralis TaxID=68401 RepID=A0ACC1HLW9_9FUNG|nr:hypothetical protein EV182_006181 [Spiromyces aspiralis]